MIMEFKTKTNRNGNSKYLAFDTGAKWYSTNCRSMIKTGYVITSRDYRYMLEQLIRNEYQRKEYCC